MFRISEQDFDQLCSNGAPWGEWARIQQEESGRWDVMSENRDEEINFSFRYAHWLEDNWANVLLGKMFLAQEGFTYQVLWDNADNTNDYWFARVEEACQAASGGFGERSKALRDLTELLRRENTGYVLLTDYERSK